MAETDIRSCLSLMVKSCIVSRRGILKLLSTCLKGQGWLGSGYLIICLFSYLFIYLLHAIELFNYLKYLFTW